MTKTLQDALHELSTLPAAAQEKIGEELLLHVEKLRRLRAKLDRGVASLERGEGRELNIEDVIRRAHARYGKS